MKGNKASDSDWSPKAVKGFLRPQRGLGRLRGQEEARFSKGNKAPESDLDPKAPEASKVPKAGLSLRRLWRLA